MFGLRIEGSCVSQELRLSKDGQLKECPCVCGLSVCLPLGRVMHLGVCVLLLSVLVYILSLVCLVVSL